MYKIITLRFTQNRYMTLFISVKQLVVYILLYPYVFSDVLALMPVTNRVGIFALEGNVNRLTN